MKLAELVHAPFNVISPRQFGTASLAAGLLGAAADHLPHLGSEDHRYTLGGIGVALLGLLVRVLADQHQMGRSLRGHNAKQDQEIEALVIQAMQQDPDGPVSRLLRSRVSQSSERGTRE